MAQIDYYISLNSPWTFMGSARLADIAKRHNATVNVVPVTLGTVFEQTGGIALPNRSDERKAYRMMELKRWSKFNDIPLVFEPKHFPHDESEGMRLVLAALKTGGDAHALVTQYGHTLWVEDRNPADPAVQNDAARRAGLDADALRSAMSAEEAAAELKRLTDEAISKGVFAVPTYVIDGEIFWGQDRLDFVEQKLAG